MEIPRHWRLKKQRYGLVGYRILQDDGSYKYEFPPMANPKKSIEVYNSNLFPPPNHQVVHGKVVRENQKQDDKGQD